MLAGREIYLAVGLIHYLIHTVIMKTAFMVSKFFNFYDTRSLSTSTYHILLHVTGLVWSSRAPWIFASLSYDGRVRPRVKRLANSQHEVLNYI